MSNKNLARKWRVCCRWQLIYSENMPEGQWAYTGHHLVCGIQLYLFIDSYTSLILSVCVIKHPLLDIVLTALVIDWPLYSPRPSQRLRQYMVEKP